MSVFEITKAATFDAAHHFPSEPEGSIYRRLHGHSFQVEATVRSEVLDAAHHFPNEPDGSPYRRMHGHSFSVEATVRGEALDSHGWVADLGALDRAL